MTRFEQLAKCIVAMDANRLPYPQLRFINSIKHWNAKELETLSDAQALFLERIAGQTKNDKQ